MSTTGHRERKKAATKQALSRAAVSLMLERGLHAVSGDAIAAAAGVAPRTFRNYFANKEQAVLFAAGDIQNRYVTTVLTRDPDEPVLDSLEAAAVALIESAGDLEQLVAGLRVIAHNPTLVAYRSASREAASATLARCVAERTGTDPDADIYPRLVSRCADAVLQSVVESYASGVIPREHLVTVVRRGFDQLRHGLERPSG